LYFFENSFENLISKWQKIYFITFSYVLLKVFLFSASVSSSSLASNYTEIHVMNKKNAAAHFVRMNIVL